MRRGLRVGIELRSAVRGASGGIVAVLEGTLQELFRRDGMEHVVFCTPFNRELLATERENVELATLPLDTFFPTLDTLARRRRLDVLFRTYPGAQLAFPGRRQMVLIPDVQHEDHPEFFDAQTLAARQEAFGLAYADAAAIATISEYAKKRIERHLPAKKDVSVMRPGVPPGFAAASSADVTAEERALVPERYFFFPANLWPAKNHDRLLEAVRRLRLRTGDESGIVLTGALDGFDELRQRYRDVPVRHLGYVRAPLLRYLYERATALTFFSLYEGFGLPLLEAFAAGTPVVCSNSASLPEVAGDGALMCDPVDVEAMSALLERVARDEDLRAELAERGRARLSLFSWGEAADHLEDGLRRVAQARRPGRLALFGRRGRDASDGRPPAADESAPTAAAPAARRRVTGYWADNWVDPRLDVVLAREPATSLRLEGVPATDMVVDLAVDDEVVQRIPLHGGKSTTIECVGPYSGRETLSFVFSQAVTDEAGRQVSFRVDATDLFSEQDLAATLP
jgi:glycosyltransferase involved in cell wall biosynthesis